MITLADKNILIGGFHDHWHRIDTENTAYLIAALNYYNYDFMTLMDGMKFSTLFQNSAAQFTNKIKLFPGQEYGCPWGHVVAIGFNGSCDEASLYHQVSELTEVDQVFACLKQAYDLVVLAHPDYDITWHELFLTGEVDRLLDDKIIDAVNIINTSGFAHHQHRIMIDWYKARETAGKVTPIVGGWDAHLIMNRLNDPDILYTQANPPQGHIDTAGYNRSIVIGAQNNLAEIIQAVKECRIVIEDIATGELVGKKQWIDFLETEQFHAKVAALDATRATITVTKPAQWLLNEPATVTFNKNGTLRYPVKQDIIEQVDVVADTPVQLKKIDIGLVRDEVAIPIAFTNEDDFEAIYSIKTLHPIRIELLPKYIQSDAGVKSYLEVKFLLPFNGNIAIECPALPATLTKSVTTTQTELLIELPKPSTAPYNYTLQATNSNGLTRTFTGIINFYPVGQFNGSWENMPQIAIDKAQFVPPTLGYGATEPWLGAELFSGTVQFAWNNAALYTRINVIDPIHDQPLTGHFIYDADCVQLAFDPLYLRRDYRGHFYNYNLALTSEGAELFQMFTPSLDINDNPLELPEDRSLGREHLTITPTPNGLIYDLRLPWELLGRDNPQLEDRIGIYMLLLNSNGNGVINSLKWPYPIDGLWMVPKLWGTIELL